MAVGPEDGPGLVQHGRAAAADHADHVGQQAGGHLGGPGDGLELPHGRSQHRLLGLAPGVAQDHRGREGQVEHDRADQGDHVGQEGHELRAHRRGDPGEHDDQAEAARPDAQAPHPPPARWLAPAGPPQPHGHDQRGDTSTGPPPRPGRRPSSAAGSPPGRLGRNRSRPASAQPWSWPPARSDATGCSSAAVNRNAGRGTGTPAGAAWSPTGRPGRSGVVADSARPATTTAARTPKVRASQAAAFPPWRRHWR